MSLRRFLHLSECRNGHYFVVMDTAPSCPVCDTREYESIDCWPRGQPPWGGRLRMPDDITSGADTPYAFLQWLSYCSAIEHMQAPYGVRLLCPGITQEVEDDRWVWCRCVTEN
jgi:hypothetical protein